MSVAAHRARLDPSADLWADLIRPSPAPSGPARAALGLPVGPPIIMVGHEPILWHPGVLAKYLAASAASAALGAAPVWLIVDHDEHELDSVRVPVRDPEGVLRAEHIPLSAEPLPERVPACLLPPLAPRPLTPRLPAALPSITEGLARISEALARHRGAPSAAAQVSRATIDLLKGLVAPGTILYASSLASTDAFRVIVDEMRRDPLACVRAYNRAAEAHPHARIAPLREAGSAGAELPLWWLGPGKPRRRVFAPELAAPPTGHTLAPRALLLTAIARAELCDLFIHGLGGARYDAITEEWISAWLGRTLAPAAVVTADLLLPFAEPPIDPALVALAAWRAHRARHDPALLGLADLALEKSHRLDQIAAARAGGTSDPRPLYASMHSFLEGYRRDHAAPLAQLTASAEDLKARAARVAVAADRTWAFPLHTRAALESLNAEILGLFRSALASR